MHEDHKWAVNLGGKVPAAQQQVLATWRELHLFRGQPVVAGVRHLWIARRAGQALGHEKGYQDVDDDDYSQHAQDDQSQNGATR